MEEETLYIKFPFQTKGNGHKRHSPLFPVGVGTDPTKLRDIILRITVGSF